jgi:hypothetical protein
MYIYIHIYKKCGCGQEVEAWAGVVWGGSEG